MEKQIALLKRLANEVSVVADEVFNVNIEYETQILTLKERISSLEERDKQEKHEHEHAINEARVTIASLEAQLASAYKTTAELHKDNQRLVEENQSMRKVSQIIAYEKENGKLKKEIEDLRSRLNNKHTVHLKDFKENVFLSNIQTNEERIEPNNEHSVNDKNSEDSTDEEACDLSVFEKRIKGKTYYVSDDETMRIFAIAPDGGIGEEVGVYEKDDPSGKMKPKFY